MNKSLISVIIPVYNAEKYLDQCLHSIVNQTHKNLEIILVNDGSSDNSGAICDEWGKKDSRIKVLHKDNGGSSSSRNLGLKNANGEYIGFVDSDDYIAEDMYEIMLSELIDSQKGISCCSDYLVLEDEVVVDKNNIVKRGVYNTEEALNEVFKFKAGTSVWRRLYKKDVLDGLEFPNGETNEEFPIIIPTHIKANGMVHVGKALYYYRKHALSVTTSYNFDPEKDFLYKNLKIMEAQIKEYKLNNYKNFNFFSAHNALSVGIIMEKNFLQLSEDSKAMYDRYRKIMKKYSLQYFFSPHSQVKDKILYLLVITRLLRPMYRILKRGDGLH